MKQLLYFLPSLLMAGCVSGPDYQPPRNAVATAAFAQGAFVSAGDITFSQEVLPEHWWSLYDDPRLDALIEQALSNNADIRVADANLRKADAVFRQTTGSRAIATNIVARAAQEQNDSAISTSADMPGIATYDLGLSASYPLDLAGKLKRAIEAGEANRDAVEAARDTVRISTAAATAKAYAGVCAANFQIASVRRVIGVQQRTLDAVIRLAQKGRGTHFDVSRAQTEVETSKAALPPLIAKRQASLFLLAALLGKPPADYPHDVAECAELPAVSRPIPVGDGAAMIRRRPDIRQAERLIAADTARIGVTMADLYPAVTLTGGVASGGKVGDIGSGHSFGFGFGPLLSWTFPNRPVVRARIAAAKAQVTIDLAHFDAVVLDALRGTETALVDYARDRERIELLDRAAESAERSAKQANMLFRFGRSDFLAVLAAQGSLAAVQVNLAEAKARLIDDQITVFLALGGGWRK